MEYPFINFNTVTQRMRPGGKRAGQPVIGLSVNIAEETSRLHEAYIRSVLEAGGIPLLIPASADADALVRMVESVDGLILTGGADVGGEYFGEETLHERVDVDPFRDAYDFLLLRLAVDRQLPVFGICRGAQVINIAFGGTIWQDLPSQYPGNLFTHSVASPREKPAHPVTVAEGSVLARVCGDLSQGVNSRHHQAIREVAEGFRVTACSPDGVAEAIEGYPERRIIGVQWHPENMAAEDGSEPMKALFRFFTEEASFFGRAKRLHDRCLTVDSHTDTPMLFADHVVEFGRRGAAAKVDAVKMTEGKMDAVVVVAYVPQGERDDASLRESYRQALGLLSEMKRQVEAASEYVGMADSFDAAERLKARGLKAVFLGLENGYGIGRDLGNIRKLKDMGLIYLTLCHNGANDICDSAIGEPEHGGLSGFGRTVVRELNRLGIVVDLSHASETSFYDALEESEAPPVCSHSSARALCDHPRNLTNEQIRALAAKGGVVQVCLYGPFLASGRQATVMDAVDHIEHIVRLVGTDYVGIGSDFDGGGGIPGCEAENGIINITVELLRRGYGETEIAGILGGNFRRVVDRAQSLAGDGQVKCRT